MLQVFDAHFHVIDPRFALVPNQGYLPDPFQCTRYLHACRSLALDPIGGAVVSGSFQAFDQDYLLSALQELGPGFFGVTQLPHTVTDARIMVLDAGGIRAVRFNLYRGGSEDVRHLDTLTRRVHEIAGWHTELYVDSQQLRPLRSTLAALPRVSIDHLGLSRSGWPDLLRLVESGARVKATGFSRTDLDIQAALQEICRINPDALLFGSDLPCTRAPRIFDEQDLQQFLEALDDRMQQKVFRENAENWYRRASD